MGRLAREGVPDVEPVTDRLGFPGAVAWLREHYRYELDPPNAELVKAPRRALREIRERGWAGGDCDDVSTWVASMALASGLGARYCVIGYDPEGPMEHVYAMVDQGDGFEPFDLTAPEGHDALAAAPSARRWDIMVNR